MIIKYLLVLAISFCACLILMPVVIACAKELCRNKLTVVFGCGGNRDKGKRYEMGKISARLCDKVVVTLDNPRDEEPQDIINDILGGCLKKPSAVEVDREKAIFLAVGKATANDIILVAGKGHEKEQVIKNVRYYFDDCEVLRKFAEKKDEK